MTVETMQAFLEMQNRPWESPIVEMNDQTARDIEIIWASIQASAASWRGEKEMHIPGQPTSRKEFWEKQFKEADSKLLPVAKQFLDRSEGVGKLAIDLGCGNSPAVGLLLKRGWKVIAVDISQAALNMLKEKFQDEITSGQLTLVEEDATVYEPSEPADLVIAADVLPYINPAKFKDLWIKIHNNFVKDNGTFIGSLFRFVESPPSSRCPMSNLQMSNIMKEMGSWLLADRRMARPLLETTGYKIEECVYLPKSTIPEPISIQFVAKKIS